MKLENSKKFAEGFSFYKIFIIFLIGSIVGTYHEQLLYFFQTWMQHGSPIWETRHGVLYGPFNPLYGAGFLLFVLVLGKKERSWWKTFIYGSLLGGCLEFIVGFLQKAILGTQAWNYSDHFLNIMGCTTIPIMLFWGLLALLVIKYIYPFLSNLIEKIPYKFGTIFFGITFVLMNLNILISLLALNRQALRHKEIEPYTFVGKLFDQVYPDEYLDKVFPNIVKVKK